MNDSISQADPYEALRGADLGGADLALFDEIVATADARLIDWKPKQRTLGSRMLRAGIAAAAVTAMIAVPTLIANGPDSNGPGTAAPSNEPSKTGPTISTPIRYAAAVIKVAQANPRVLVTEPGWKVRSLEGFGPTSGGITFQLGPDEWHDVQYAGGSSHQNDASQISINWYPADQYENYRRSRSEKGDDLEQKQVLGQDAQVFSYSATDHAALLEPEGKVFLEIRGRLGDRAAFESFLRDDLAKVGVQEWLEAMPASVVTADNEGVAAAAVLVDMPLPPGFDRDSLGSAVALDPYQFGARVTGAVTCGWLAEWTRAHQAGDSAAQQAAVTALGTSRQWKVLQDMDVEGDYPEVIWEYADLIAAGQPPAGYRQALGC